MRGFNLKKIYNIYVKIAQANFVYQPSKPKAITAMPFDWIETQNLLEKYLEDHGADFDALCREYVSENVKDDHLPSAQPERKWTPCSNPPKHHKDVIVRGIEAIGNVTVHKVMQWDVDTWRPTDYAPSIMWQEWSEI